jgi:hypothetical protein
LLWLIPARIWTKNRMINHMIFPPVILSLVKVWARII